MEEKNNIEHLDTDTESRFRTEKLDKVISIVLAAIITFLGFYIISAENYINSATPVVSYIDYVINFLVIILWSFAISILGPAAIGVIPIAPFLNFLFWFFLVYLTARSIGKIFRKGKSYYLIKYSPFILLIFLTVILLLFVNSDFNKKIMIEKCLSGELETKTYSFFRRTISITAPFMCFEGMLWSDNPRLKENLLSSESEQEKTIEFCTSLSDKKQVERFGRDVASDPIGFLAPISYEEYCIYTAGEEYSLGSGLVNFCIKYGEITNSEEKKDNCIRNDLKESFYWAKVFKSPVRYLEYAKIRCDELEDKLFEPCNAEAINKKFGN